MGAVTPARVRTLRSRRGNSGQDGVRQYSVMLIFRRMAGAGVEREKLAATLDKVGISQPAELDTDCANFQVSEGPEAILKDADQVIEHGPPEKPFPRLVQPALRPRPLGIQVLEKLSRVALKLFDIEQFGPEIDGNSEAGLSIIASHELPNPEDLLVQGGDEIVPGPVHCRVH